MDHFLCLRRLSNFMTILKNSIKMCNLLRFISVTLMIGAFWRKVGWILGRRYKLRGSYYIVQLIGAFILIGIFGVAGIFSGTNALETYRDAIIRQEGDALDQALKLYAKRHYTSYPTGENDEEGFPITREYGIYPVSVDELHYQVRYGNISTLLIDKLKLWSRHDSNALIGDFYYEASKDRRAYLLQVRLSNGYIYTTPGSLYTIKDVTWANSVDKTLSESKNEWRSSISGYSKN